MLRSRSASLLPLTSRTGLPRDPILSTRRKGGSRGCGTCAVVLILLVLVLGSGGAWWHLRARAPAPAHASVHDAFLAKHGEVQRAEARFEREIRRRHEGGDGGLTQQTDEHAQGMAHAAHAARAAEEAHAAEAAAARREAHQSLTATLEGKRREGDGQVPAAPEPPAATAAIGAVPRPQSLYDQGIKVRNAAGEDVPISTFAGKVLLVVNVASQCGYTKTNYEGLQKLYNRYSAFGLEILAFPCNQFGSQEPGSLAEIAAFASSTYHITFPLMDKVDVNGVDETPLFAWLKEHTPGAEGGADLSWNFNKFLVDKWGIPRKRYASSMDYALLESDVYAELVRNAAR